MLDINSFAMQSLMLSYSVLILDSRLAVEASGVEGDKLKTAYGVGFVQEVSKLDEVGKYLTSESIQFHTKHIPFSYFYWD